MRALMPCFISDAEHPSAWTYAVSFIFNAPSMAIGNKSPRPSISMSVTSLSRWCARSATSDSCPIARLIDRGKATIARM